jgi:hypothetical protein
VWAALVVDGEQLMDRLLTAYGAIIQEADDLVR